MVVDAINGKTRISNDITDLVEDIKHLLNQFSENRLKYYNRIISRDVALVKMDQV